MIKNVIYGCLDELLIVKMLIIFYEKKRTKGK